MKQRNLYTFFGIFLVSMLMVPSAFAENFPDWVKTTSGWWATDAISETEFVNAVEFLVKENIIQINVSQTSQLPDWLVNNAGWWAARIFTNSDFSDFDLGYVKERIFPCDIDSSSHACFDSTLNSYGFRGDEFEKVKPNNTYRIFAVGGSTTYGIGALHSETWSAHLQKIINEMITDKELSLIHI